MAATPADWKWLDGRPWMKHPDAFTLADVAAARRLLRMQRTTPQADVTTALEKFFHLVNRSRPELLAGSPEPTPKGPARLKKGEAKRLAEARERESLTVRYRELKAEVRRLNQQELAEVERCSKRLRELGVDLEMKVPRGSRGGRGAKQDRMPPNAAGIQVVSGGAPSLGKGSR